MQALVPLRFADITTLPSAAAHPNSIVIQSGVPYFSNGTTWTQLDMGQPAGGEGEIQARGAGNTFEATGLTAGAAGSARTISRTGGALNLTALLPGWPPNIRTIRLDPEADAPVYVINGLLTAPMLHAYNVANYAVDLLTAQTVAGNKSFTGQTSLASLTITSATAGNSTAVNTASVHSAVVADDGLTGGSGGVVVFGAASGAWKFAAIKGFVTNGTGNSVGDLSISTRRAMSDPTLTEVIRIKYDGNVGFGGSSSPTASIDTNGFTKLGDAAPKVKLKKLTGTTSGSTGGSVNIAHGVTLAKILAVEVLVNTSGSLRVPPAQGATSATTYYTVSLSSTNLTVTNGSSATGVTSQSITALVTYEE